MQEDRPPPVVPTPFRRYPEGEPPQAAGHERLVPYPPHQFVRIARTGVTRAARSAGKRLTMTAVQKVMAAKRLMDPGEAMVAHPRLPVATPCRRAAHAAVSYLVEAVPGWIPLCGWSRR